MFEYDLTSAPSFQSLTLDPNDPYSVPRLYHRPAEDLNSGLSSGGGGHQSSGDSSQVTSYPSQGQQSSQFGGLDTPYVPPRNPHPSQRNFHSHTHPGYATSLPLPYRHESSSQRYDSGPSSWSLAPLQSQGSYSEDRNLPALQHNQWGTMIPQGHYQPPIQMTAAPIYGASRVSYTSRSFDHLPLPSSSSISGTPQVEGSSADPLPITMHPGASESRYPDAGEYLRKQLNIAPGQPVNLWSIPTPTNGAKPTYPLPILIKLAIYGSPRKKLTLQEIYTALEERFQWFYDHRHENAWKNSIRHNLSLNKVFRNSQRPITEPGKGSYWELDVSGGEGYKRERKRRKKTAGRAVNEAEEEQSEEESDDASPQGSPGATPDEEYNIDPQLRQEGFSGSVSRTRSMTKRSSPYPQTSSIQSRTQSSLEVSQSTQSSRSNSGSASPPRHFLTETDTLTTSPMMERAPAEPRFDQSSFGVPSLGPYSGYGRPANPQASRPTFGQSSLLPPPHMMNRLAPVSAPAAFVSGGAGVPFTTVVQSSRGVRSMTDDLHLLPMRQMNPEQTQQMQTSQSSSFPRSASSASTTYQGYDVRRDTV